MKPIIINQNSEDTDCAHLICYHIFLDGIRIWPTRAGQEVENVNA